MVGGEFGLEIVSLGEYFYIGEWVPNEGDQYLEGSKARRLLNPFLFLLVLEETLEPLTISFEMRGFD